jgi:hypothetical protein
MGRRVLDKRSVSVPDIPQQFVLPFRIRTDGQLATVNQASAQDIGQRVMVLCRTPLGYLTGGQRSGVEQAELDRSGFGLADQAFREGGADIATIRLQIDTHIVAYVGDTALDVAVEDDSSMIDAGLELIGIQVTG